LLRTPSPQLQPSKPLAQEVPPTMPATHHTLLDHSVDTPASQPPSPHQQTNACPQPPQSPSLLATPALRKPNLKRRLSRSGLVRASATSLVDDDGSLCAQQRASPHASPHATGLALRMRELTVCISMRASARMSSYRSSHDEGEIGSTNPRRQDISVVTSESSVVTATSRISNAAEHDRSWRS
jgi:hypothetical protein